MTFKKEKLNSNWKNGKSIYKNHGLLKRTRKIKLRQQPLCEDCGEKVEITHHIDKSTDNHNIENLKALCRLCHPKYHPVKERIEYKKIYGFSRYDLARILSIGEIEVKKLHKSNKLYLCGFGDQRQLDR